jgi:hypothetical protein
MLNCDVMLCIYARMNTITIENIPGYSTWGRCPQIVWQSSFASANVQLLYSSIKKSVMLSNCGVDERHIASDSPSTLALHEFVTYLGLASLPLSATVTTSDSRLQSLSGHTRLMRRGL